MNTVTKLGGFVAAVAVVFGSAMAVGAGVGPIDVGDEPTHRSSGAVVATQPRGLAIAQAGYRLVPDADELTAATPSTYGFRILDRSGAAVTVFDELHERPLHLVVLSRNLFDYLHLHPVMDDTGHWSIELPPLAPGSYRVFADFQPSGGDNLTLGTDLTVPGNVVPSAPPAPSTVDTVSGYEVTLSGAPAVGESELSFDVELDGETVRTEPYLGAAGHLVAIRAGDLAYLHVHPHSEAESSTVTFTAEFPTAGTYRLFFDFAHAGDVRTASYTVVVPDLAGDDLEPTDSDDDDDEGH